MQSKPHSLVRRETLRIALPGCTPWGWAGHDLVYAALGGPSLFFLFLLRILSEWAAAGREWLVLGWGGGRVIDCVNPHLFAKLNLCFLQPPGPSKAVDQQGQDNPSPWSSGSGVHFLYWRWYGKSLTAGAFGLVRLGFGVSLPEGKHTRWHTWGKACWVPPSLRGTCQCRAAGRTVRKKEGVLYTPKWPWLQNSHKDILKALGCPSAP